MSNNQITNMSILLDLSCAVHSYDLDKFRELLPVAADQGLLNTRFTFTGTHILHRVMDTCSLKHINHCRSLIRLEMVKLLLAAKADPNMSDERGNYPLHSVDHWKKRRCQGIPKLVFLRTLVEAGANLNVVDQYGDTILLRCVRRKDYNWCRLLLEMKASPNVEDKSGYTPLMHSVSTKQANSTKLLIDARADVTRLPEFVEGSYQTAKQRECTQLIRDELVRVYRELVSQVLTKDTTGIVIAYAVQSAVH